MQPGDDDGDWEAASKELLTGMKAWREVHAHATLSEIEAELDRRMRKLRDCSESGITSKLGGGGTTCA